MKLKSINLISGKSPLLSPGTLKIAWVSMVVLVAVGAIVVIAHQATPSATAAPVAKTVTASAPAPAAPHAATARKGTSARAKTANAATSAQISDVVTITGCLEEKGDTFRLKDTAGTDAPKSRSWKTLGLTKHASTVTVVDDANRMKLESHVGERVSVTGTMADKELQGRSIKSLDPSCS